MNYTTTLLALAVIATPAYSQANLKSHYHLFNPTPREMWRPMSADRPDFTESPITVDAGAVQLEMSFADYAKNSGTDALGLGLVNLKIGLLNNTDVQFVYDSFIEEDNGSTTSNGNGDMQVRLKINLFGNDGGNSALGIMPFIKIPLASNDLGNDKVEGGIIVPWGTDITEGVGLGLMFEVDFNYDTATNEYDSDFIGTGVLGFDINDKWGCYLEGIAKFSSDSGTDNRTIVGIGTTYAFTENYVWDAGMNIGLKGDTDDVNIFTGITVRF